MNPSTAILFIGGDKTAHRSMQVLFDKLTPCRLDSARNEGEALARLARARYVTIIVDVTGPLAQVEPLLLKIRKTHDATPLILLTDHAYSADDFSFAESHAITDLIPKPLRVPEHLIFSVKKALANQRLTCELEGSRKQAAALSHKSSRAMDKHGILEKKMEEMETAKVRAEHANRFKSPFLASFSHKIRTSMSGVIGMSDLLLRTPLSNEQRQFADAINRSGDDLLSLINEILDFSKQIAEIMEGGIRVLILEESPAPEHSIQDWLKRGGCRPVTVTTPHDARLALKTIHYDLVLISLEHPQGWAMGTAQAMRAPDSMVLPPHIPIIALEEIVTEKKRHACLSSGINACISKRMPQDKLLDTIHEYLLKASKGLHTLLVEDDEVNRLITLNMLELMGHNVVMATNGREAVEAYGNRSFDLILMDMQMPVMDGMEATRLIRDYEADMRTAAGRDHGKEVPAEEFHTPVIALTAHATKGDKEAFLASGMDGYVAKPIRIIDLALVISRRISGNLNALLPKEEQQEDALPPAAESEAYETVDIEDALRIMNGKENILLRCFELFVEILPPTLESIAHAIDRTDETALNRSLHKFKGTLKNIAAKRAVYLAGLIENAGKEGDMVVAGKHLDALVQECENIKAFIDRRKNEALPN